MSSEPASAEGAPSTAEADRDRLPPALAAMWRLCRIGLHHEPRLAVASLTVTLLAALPNALLAWWLKVLADAVLAREVTVAVATGAAIAASATGTWLLRLVSTRVTRRFRDRIAVALESHVARLQASVPGLEHHERADYLDRLAVLRSQVFVLDHMYLSLLGTVGWLVQLGITLALLATISPLLVLLVLFAVPTVLSSTWRPAVERRVEEAQAAHARLAEHLFNTSTTASAGKEVRVAGLQTRLATERQREWRRWYAPVSRARWLTALSHSLAWAVFGLGYVAAVVYVAVVLQSSVGSVLLILAAGARLSAYVAETVSEIGFLRGVWLDGSRRLVWLEGYAAAAASRADRPAPDAIHDAITLDHVDFAYPGTDQLALADVTLRLPAGAVVAVVGENGAGKSTLVKLLTQMYQPSRGTIAVDGVPLDRIAVADWRARTAGAFQDFFRFEFSARRSIGLGDLPFADSDPAVTAAVRRGGAVDVVVRLPSGLDTQLGPTWPQGHELSFGQWQKMALARGFMREQPLLLVLDEPTAALDAETEHALFERYAEVGHAVRGGITILVSHRFSTVRMADLIVVLDGCRVSEVGTHDELIAAGGGYAELFRIQAAAYR